MPVPCDLFNRSVNYLRISVTDRCNLRCIYCMPSEGVSLLPRSELLSYEEIVTVVRVAAEMGVNKIRLTGGEPLVREGLCKLVTMISRVPGVDDISLTTNGIFLQAFAGALKEAGLRRVNVSLDSLKKDRYRCLTRGGNLDEVLCGIETARKVGLTPVKVNMVVMRGINDDEVEHFASLTISDGWHVRFIELMPFFAGKDMIARFVATEEVKERVGRIGDLEAAVSVMGSGPARYYRFRGASGTVGFISPVSEHFCFSCNRLRLTADGKLRPCLLSEHEIDLRPYLRCDAVSSRSLEGVISDAIKEKPRQGRLGGEFAVHRPMWRLGG